MTPNIEETANAFSRHRFTETYPHLAPDVRWVSVGESTLAGRDAVVHACESAAAHLAEVTTEFTRFVCVVDADAVAVDAVGRYTDADGGGVSVVSSCDIYEFDRGQLTAITSYAVELPAD